MEDNMNNNTYTDLLGIFESLLRSQLNTIKQLKKNVGIAEEEKPKEKRMSHMEMTYDILDRAGHPMHITEILAAIKKQFDVDLDRESVVSALVKRVKRNDRFIKTGPNTFALIDQHTEGGLP
jgi:hypothetical protein